jgi:hypothetical protein
MTMPKCCGYQGGSSSIRGFLNHKTFWTSIFDLKAFLHRVQLIIPRSRLLGGEAGDGPPSTRGSLGALYKLKDRIYFEEPAGGCSSEPSSLYC